MSVWLRRTFGWSLDLFRIRGIQLSVHSTFFLLLAYFAWEGWTESRGTGLYWNIVTLLGCFTCVVFHELGHSFTAQHYGVGVPRILLMPIGGMAQFDRIPRRPREELLITVAGPAVNFLIVAVFFCCMKFPHGWWNFIGTYSIYGFLYQLFAWNAVMGCFNLLPAFPMDGGRILRALLATQTNYLSATWWAATVGKVVCVLGMGVGMYLRVPLWVVLFGFIFIVGEMELRAVKRMELADEQWRRLLARVETPPLEEPPFLPR